MAIQEVFVSKIFNYTSEPTKKVEGQFWFNPSTNVLSRYTGTVWKPITVGSDDVAVLSDGSKISLTNYLNTQIAALAEGIDSKQDKLLYYSEEDLDGSHPVSGRNYGKYATINTSADSGGSSIVNINTYSPFEGDSEINLHADNTYNASLISLSAHSGDGSGGGNSKISLAAVKDEYDGSQITKSYNSNIDVDCKSITLSSNALSIKLDGYSQSTSGIYINGELYGSSISTSIPVSNAVDTKVVSEKAVKTELDKKQDKLLYYSESSEGTPSVTISVANINLTGKVAEGSETTASGTYSHAEGYNTTASGYGSHAEGRYTAALSMLQHVQGIYNIEDANNKYADIIGNGSEDHGVSNAQTVSWDGISWSQTDVRAGGTDQDSAAHSLSAKQNATDNNLTTIDKTIVGAINEINSIFNVNALPTPITDVKTITTTLENLITDTQYANKPGTILINPNIKNTGAILVGEAITDISKAFPVYTDQPVTIAFKNINDFKVAGDIAGESFNYIISFGYINQNITSDSLTIATNNGVYTITPEGDTESETLKISKIG